MKLKVYWMEKILIITELDGTLLNFRDNSFESALPALKRVRELSIPLIFCSSMTSTQIEDYQEKLQNIHPFISENGGGVFIPDNYFSFQLNVPRHGKYRLISLGKSYHEIRAQFMTLQEKTDIKPKGIGDMTAREIAELTGLSTTEAELARQRDFGEPFIFQDKPDEVFLQYIEQAGLHWTRGRLFHVMRNHDKGKAFEILKAFYQKEGGIFHTIGLGDSFNDLTILKAVDHPVLIRQENGHHNAELKYQES